MKLDEALWLSSNWTKVKQVSTRDLKAARRVLQKALFTLEYSTDLRLGRVTHELKKRIKFKRRQR